MSGLFAITYVIGMGIAGGICYGLKLKPIAEIWTHIILWPFSLAVWIPIGTGIFIGRIIKILNRKLK